MPVKAIRQQIAGAVDVVIQANRLQGGPRRVTHITEIVGMEQDTVVMQDIYRFNQEGIDESGKALAISSAPAFDHPSCHAWRVLGSVLPGSAFRQRIMMKA